MSRESDLAQLKELQQDIYDLYELGDKCNVISGKITTLFNEKEHPKKPVYDNAPVNNYETLKKQYTSEWTKKYSNIKFFRILFLMLNVFAIIAVGVIFVSDVLGNTGYVLPPEKVAELGNLTDILALCVVHIFVSLLFIIMPIVLCGKES